jgi:hypothetical protein
MFLFFPTQAVMGLLIAYAHDDDCYVLFYPAQTLGLLTKLRFRLSDSARSETHPNR